MTCGCSQAGLGQVGRGDGTVMVVLLIGIVPLLSRVTTQYSSVSIIFNNSMNVLLTNPQKKHKRITSGLPIDSFLLYSVGQEKRKKEKNHGAG